MSMHWRANMIQVFIFRWSIALTGFWNIFFLFSFFSISMISKNYPIVYMKVFSCFDYHCVSDLYWKNYIWSFSGCIHLLVHKLWYPDFSPSSIIPMSIWHDKSMVVECLSDTPIYLKILTILIFFFLFKNRDKREKKEWGFLSRI